MRAPGDDSPAPVPESRPVTRVEVGPSTVERERWQRLKAAFVDVVEQQRTAREAALAGIAARDPVAAAEARSILRRFDHAATSFLDRTALLAGGPSEELPDLTGRTIGGYRLTAALGRGGMGAVYEAVREEDGKRAAVKLLRWHADPAEVEAQMRAERRILAGLEHDNIARLIDGGITEEGWPYFTLELVDGEPIGAYCEERGLDVPARLRLFGAVCAAVDYAHQRLVIHCDIKPANIQVTYDGVPKLLDFGIARLRRPDALTGESSELAPTIALTPEYASPEQVRGQPVTTATDVYALGLLLYELLTGRRAQPLSSFEPAEIVRVVCETRPPQPSAVAPPERRRRLRGDLDAIVLRALAKDPAGRYGSVRELDRDVRRHLRFQTVAARGGGATYRAGRFLRRHRAAFAAGLLIAASLVGGLVAAMREARRAQRRFEDVRQLAGSFLFEFHDAIRELPGATPARQLLVTKALQYLDSLAREAGDDVGLTRELAVAYQRVGDVQGYTANANLGDTPGAVASFQKAVALAERLVAANRTDTASRLTLGVALEHLGTALGSAGEGAAARQSLERSLTLLEELHRELPSDRDVARSLHVAHIRMGRLSKRQGDPDAALASYQAAQRVDESYLAEVPGDARARRDLSVALSLVAAIVGDRDPARGLELYQAMLPPALELAASDPTNAELQRDLLVGYEDVAQMQTRLGQLPAALENQQRALEIAEALLRADPANQQALQDLSVRHAQIGDVLLAMGRLPEALESYRRSLDLDARVAAHNPTDTLAAEYLGWSHLNVAKVLEKLGEARGALDAFGRAIEVVTPHAERDPENAQLQLVLADGYAGRGENLLPRAGAGGCAGEAGDALLRAVAIWDALDLEPGPDQEHRDRIAARLAACSRAPAS